MLENTSKEPRPSVQRKARWLKTLPSVVLCVAVAVFVLQAPSQGANSSAPGSFSSETVSRGTCRANTQLEHTAFVPFVSGAITAEGVRPRRTATPGVICTPTPMPSGAATSAPTSTSAPASTPTASSTPAPTPTPSDSPAYPFGVFEDIGTTGSSSAFQAMITDLTSRGLDSTLFTNGYWESSGTMLNTSDADNYKTVFSIMGDLDRDWFNNNSVTVDLTTADQVIGPYVDQMKVHPSVSGYNIIDDANPSLNEKIRLAVNVFRNHDPSRPASPMMVQGKLGIEVYDYVRPDVFLTYNYPAWNLTAPCDFNRAERPQDFVDLLRYTTQLRPPDIPLWIVLQTHNTTTSTTDIDPNALRVPTVEEVRLQNWLAVGEEAKGIWWFQYSTEQMWLGLKDNPTLYTEVTDLANRMNTLKPYLTPLVKMPDKFSGTTASPSAYLSTFRNPTTGVYYVLAANYNCAAQDLTINSDYFDATLKDLETGQSYNLGAPIAFRGGDGKLFEVDNPVPLTPPAPQANLILNGSFETSTNGTWPDDWPVGPAVFSLDTTVAHTGKASLKVTGPATFSYIYQNPTLKPGTRYYLSFWVKANGLVQNFIGARYSQIQPNTTAPYLADVYWNQEGSFGWTKHMEFFTVPATLTSGRFDVVWELNSVATAWIDDVTLCEAAKPCPDTYLGERETAASPAPTLTSSTLGVPAYPTDYSQDPD
jgi:hypothetical protein